MGFKEDSYKSFELFNKDWALVTAGPLEDYNTMVIGWGELGTIWGKPMKALGYLGSHSGRDGDKVAASGLTPVAMGEGVTFEEAKLTFLCKKIYFHQMSKDGLAQEIKDYYAANPKGYPNVTPDGTDDNWELHYAIIGEIMEAQHYRHPVGCA